LRTGDENRVISPLVVLEGIKQLLASHSFFNGLKWWPGTELNRRRQPFQGCALPPELPGHFSKPAHRCGLRGLFTSRRLLRDSPRNETAHCRNACGTLSIIAMAASSLNVRRFRGRHPSSEAEALERDAISPATRRGLTSQPRLRLNPAIVSPPRVGLSRSLPSSCTG
jgi:hypothetical protein